MGTGNMNTILTEKLFVEVVVILGLLDMKGYACSQEQACPSLPPMGMELTDAGAEFCSCCLAEK